MHYFPRAQKKTLFKKVQHGWGSWETDCRVGQAAFSPCQTLLRGSAGLVMLTKISNLCANTKNIPDRRFKPVYSIEFATSLDFLIGAVYHFGASSTRLSADLSAQFWAPKPVVTITIIMQYPK